MSLESLDKEGRIVITDEMRAQVAADMAAFAEVTPTPAPEDRIANLEAALIAVTKSAAVKDDPELAKAAAEVAAIEATRERIKPAEPVEPLPDEPPVKGGGGKTGRAT